MKALNFFVGGRYTNGNVMIRTITKIHGDDIHWHDDFGTGNCSRATFESWAVGLASDSPEPLFPQRRRVIPFKIVDLARYQILAMQNLKDINIESKNEEFQKLAEISMWAIRQSLGRMKDAIENQHHLRLRVITDVDRNAEVIQGTIIRWLDFLKSAEMPSKEVPPPQLAALSGGLESVNRLRAGLAPYLVR